MTKRDSSRSNGKLISAIKVKTRTLKDKRKNVRKALDCIKGKQPADCHYTCQIVTKYNGLSRGQKAVFMYNMLADFDKLTWQINQIGKTILFLRDGKWSF